MKKFNDLYLQLITEDLDVSSKYIDKKYLMTIDHIDIFITNTFFNAFEKDYTKLNNFLVNVIHKADVKNLKKDTQLLVYTSANKVATVINIYLKGTYRYDMILMVSYNSNEIPRITKTGQVRLII